MFMSWGVFISVWGLDFRERVSSFSGFFFFFNENSDLICRDFCINPAKVLCLSLGESFFFFCILISLWFWFPCSHMLSTWAVLGTVVMQKENLKHLNWKCYPLSFQGPLLNLLIPFLIFCLHQIPHPKVGANGAKNHNEVG